jgi:hypothetical protein
MLFMPAEELEHLDLTFTCPRGVHEVGPVLLQLQVPSADPFIVCLQGLSESPLMPGGADTQVTIHNVEEYVRLHSEFIMQTNVKRALKLMKAGFQIGIPRNILSTLTPEQFTLLLSGAGDVSAEELIAILDFSSGDSLPRVSEMRVRASVYVGSWGERQ